jgi:hypothetical protein
MEHADRLNASQERQQRGGQLLRAGGDQGSYFGEYEWLVDPEGRARRVGAFLRGVVARFSNGLDGDLDATTAKGCSEEELRQMRRGDGAQEVRRYFGGSQYLPEEEVLQPSLCEPTRRCDEGGAPSAGAAASQGGMRKVRIVKEPPCAPHGRKPVKQRPAEPSDIVRYLSSHHALEKLARDPQTFESLQTLRSACAQAGYVSETLHAFQETWLSLSCEERERFRDLVGSLFVVEPIQLLGSGIKGRTHRIRALGNAVVPQITEEIARAIMIAEGLAC